MGKDLADRTIEAVTDKLNEYYPEFAPWKTIDYELTEDGEFVHRNFLQITRSGKRQPLHFDGGPLWYADENNKLGSPLSTVINLNDGVGTYVSGDPLCGMFEKLLKISGPLAAGKSVLNYLEQCETKLPNPPSTQRADPCLSPRGASPCWNGIRWRARSTCP